jgi:hypothetical protein
MEARGYFTLAFFRLCVFAVLSTSVYPLEDLTLKRINNKFDVEQTSENKTASVDDPKNVLSSETNSTSASQLPSAAHVPVVARQGWESNFRIPSAVEPVHYNVYLNPDMGNGTFTGSVAVHFLLKEPQPYLVIHNKNLTIDTSELFGGEHSCAGSREYI